jgi:hypothetical protein
MHKGANDPPTTNGYWRKKAKVNLLAMTKSERTVEIEVCIKLISFLLVSSA